MHNPTQTLILLTPGFPIDESDTTCLPMQQAFVKEWKASNHGQRIVVLALQYPYHTTPYRWNGIEVIPFAGRNRGGLTRLLLRRKIARTLTGISKDSEGCTLLSLWYGECAHVAHSFSQRSAVPHHCWIMGQDARKDNRYPQNTSLPSSSLIALSDFLRDEFERNHGIRPAYVAPPGIDLDEFGDLALLRDIDILAAGSLIPLKRFDLFIDIIASTLKTHTLNKVIIAGDGPERAALQRKIDAMGLGNHIKLVGELPHPDLLRLMQRTRVFLHPSSYEGYSGVCQEAIAAGAEVISSCYPMHKPIAHWHQAHTIEEMAEMAILALDGKLLNDGDRVITIQECVNQMKGILKKN